MKCKICGYKFDGHTAPENLKAKPAPGDISVCFNCGTLGMYDNDLIIQPAPDQDIKAVLTAEQWKLLKHSQAIIRARYRQAN